MKKAIAIIGSLLFVFIFTSVSFTAGAKETSTVTSQEKKKKVSGHKKVKKITGEVTAIDLKAKSLTVGGITIIADEKMLADIKMGDKVTVKYITRGMNTAISITPESELNK